jgi:hypothetical protein
MEIERVWCRSCSNGIGLWHTVELAANGQLYCKQHDLRAAADEAVYWVLRQAGVDGCAGFLWKWRNYPGFREKFITPRRRERGWIDPLALPLERRHAHAIARELSNCAHRIGWSLIPQFVVTRERIGRIISKNLIHVPLHFLIWSRDGRAILPGLPGIVIGYDKNYTTAHVLYRYARGGFGIRIAKFKNGRWVWVRK